MVYGFWSMSCIWKVMFLVTDQIILSILSLSTIHSPRCFMIRYWLIGVFLINIVNTLFLFHRHWFVYIPPIFFTSDFVANLHFSSNIFMSWHGRMFCHCASFFFFLFPGYVHIRCRLAILNVQINHILLCISLFLIKQRTLLANMSAKKVNLPNFN